jgi:hypothetical protein
MAITRMPSGGSSMSRMKRSSWRRQTRSHHIVKHCLFEAARQDQLGARALVSDAGGVVCGTIRAIPAHKLDHRVDAPGYHRDRVDVSMFRRVFRGVARLAARLCTSPPSRWFMGRRPVLLSSASSSAHWWRGSHGVPQSACYRVAGRGFKQQCRQAAIRTMVRHQFN